MPNRFKAAIAIFLLVLTAMVGQAGIRQCLCTGQIDLGSEVICGCSDTSCCEEHGQPSPDQQPPSPCDDDTCWLLITLGKADQPAPLATTPAPLAIVPPAFAGLDHVSPQSLATPPAFRQRPPDRRAVPLTILFSSFLI